MIHRRPRKNVQAVPCVRVGDLCAYAALIKGIVLSAELSTYDFSGRAERAREQENEKKEKEIVNLLV